MNRVKRVLAPAIPLLSSGCTYAALDNASPEAATVTRLHWQMFWVCGGVFALVIGALVAALLRKSGSADTEGERRRWKAVAAAVVASGFVLLILLAASVVAGRRVATPPGPGALEIQVIGHQWWWEVHYPARVASDEVVTANEIHVPVERPVRLELASYDVIHSFWAPNLNGKKDLIPGRATTQTFRATRPGMYEGRCAEFCGYQHAHMGFRIIAESPAEFDAWLEAQRRPAAEPADAAEEHGRQVFLTGTCVTCHAIRGAGAFAHKAPDLTHLASRSTIAAATLPNTTGHLAGWVVDSQRIKPGNRMPPNILPSADLLDLVAYLRRLR